MPRVIVLQGEHNFEADVEGYDLVTSTWELYFENYSRLNNTADLFIKVRVMWSGSNGGYRLKQTTGYGGHLYIAFSRDNEHMFTYTDVIWEDAVSGKRVAPNPLTQVTRTYKVGTVNFDNWNLQGSDLVEVSLTCSDTFHSIQNSGQPENYLICNTTRQSDNLYLPCEVIRGVVSIREDSTQYGLYVPTIYNGSSWDEYIPNIRESGSWKECSS